jgi:hypothetical protein
MASKLHYVEISWMDAHDAHLGEWVDPKKVDIGIKVVTIGILVKKTKKYITVTHTKTEEGDVRGTFNIPIATIVGIKTLK